MIMRVIMILAAVFGLLGSVMAFLITYLEYERHKFPRDFLIKESFKSALAALFVLFGLTVIAGYLFLKLG